MRISGEDSSDRRRHQDAARLPVGIDAIRKHLAEVDNVPLLVPLFTDCTESTTRQMISIQQENGEVVLVVGGPNKGLCFEQADVSFVMRGHDSNDLDRVTGYQLLFPSDAPLGLVVSTLRLGRMLQNNVRQCLLMSIIGNVTLSVVLISVEWIELGTYTHFLYLIFFFTHTHTHKHNTYRNCSLSCSCCATHNLNLTPLLCIRGQRCT